MFIDLLEHQEQCCPIELSVVMEMFYILSNLAAMGHWDVRALEEWLVQLKN